ncbi:MAG TPA: hypothetical protein DCS64_10865 [Algoriphagus sp.]|uniref:acyltransferase n=1 Tax=Algoriphagus sp. TaxID=1872435 RepID=UPI000E915518|nr:hypothetical protein [Algoriphagus sp.]HAS58979.1 hypothetical protein [Algoriphagus sp.]
MIRFLTLLICLIPLSFLKPVLLNLIGHNISLKARIGFSIVAIGKMKIGDGSRIGNFNFLKFDYLEMSSNAIIGRFNFLRGNFIVVLKEKSAIGNSCVITRAGKGVSYGKSALNLGVLAKITAGHKIDMMRSINLGDFSIIAGSHSQLWTHGYLHAPTGPDRFRIDGEINIGNNVYVGSSCVINAGVYVADGITIGSSSCISKNLTKSGMYVAQPLRYIEKDYEDSKKKLKKINLDGLVEEVYEKPSKG